MYRIGAADETSLSDPLPSGHPVAAWVADKSGVVRHAETPMLQAFAVR
ncbi:hypothetical protein ACIP1U_20140 [Cupriavidus sp. NPDC089707]